MAGAHSIIKFNVTAQISDDCAGEPNRILPLHAHVTTARLIKNVYSRLSEKREAPR
jgi:hypothetical protein